MVLHYERGGTLTMLASSIPLGSIWLLAFAVTYADALILGSRFPDAVVGGYMFAYVWAFFASRVLQQPIGRALYPALVQFGDRPEQQFLAYRLATKVLLAIEVPAALFLFLNADLVVQILGGERYADQADLLRLLAFAPLVDPLGRFGGELLVARNRDRDRILSLVLHLTALVAGGLYLAHRFGPVGMAWANFLALGAPVLLWSLARIDRAGPGPAAARPGRGLRRPAAALRPRLVGRRRRALAALRPLGPRRARQPRLVLVALRRPFPGVFRAAGRLPSASRAPPDRMRLRSHPELRLPVLRHPLDRSRTCCHERSSTGRASES